MADLIGDIEELLGVEPGELRRSVEEQQQIDHLDFGVRCRSQGVVVHLGDVVERKARCEREAAWLAVCNDCDAPTYVCDEHKQAGRTMVARCGSCGHTGGPLLFSFTPIGGAA